MSKWTRSGAPPSVMSTAPTRLVKLESGNTSREEEGATDEGVAEERVGISERFVNTINTVRRWPRSFGAHLAARRLTKG